MPTPSHRPASFKANRVFTDRDEARELFAQQGAAPQQQDEYRVLNFYGVGGQGKSALCGQFEKHLDSLPNSEERQLAWAKINFEDSNKRNPIAALMALRLQLAANGKLWFPAFDTAFARYFAITQAGRNLETSYPELFQQSHDLLQGLATVAESVTGLALLGNIIERLQKVDEKRILRQWMKRRGAELLTGLENFAPHELESKLVEFLGADVDDWLHNEINAPQRRVVFLYDTYEALWRDQPSKTDLLVDKWVRKLVSESPAVLHVILGREALAWAQQDSEEWQDIITPCPLDHLTDTDADSFLQTVPVVENDIRARIVESAKGIPFYLNLQVDQYESCKRRNLTPQADEYGGKEPEMLARFISHLPDTTRRALRVASYPRWLDETLFLNLCEKFLGGAAVISLHELTAYSFWTKQADRYFLHAVMRDYLQVESLEHETTIYRNIHQHLFDCYDGKLQVLKSNREFREEHTEAIGEGAYHLEKFNSKQIPYWVENYYGVFYFFAQWATLKPLLKKSILIIKNNNNYIDESTMKNNLGTICYHLGDHKEACNYLKSAFIIHKKNGNRIRQADVLSNISQILHDQNEHHCALKYLRKALIIQQSMNYRRGEAITLNNIAQLYRDIGLYDSSLEYLMKSKIIFEEISDHEHIARNYNNISQIYQIRKEYKTARELLNKSLEISNNINDLRGLSITLFSIAVLNIECGDEDNAINNLNSAYLAAKKINNHEAFEKIKNIANSKLFNRLHELDIFTE
jgi:tetratricopeptide (TPR) repeat protein